MRLYPLLVILGGVMYAQPPTLTVNDYLGEVRIAPGPGPLAVTLTNTTGGPVELRILYSVAKAGRIIPRVTLYSMSGTRATFAPNMTAGDSFWEGISATASIDSATLPDGRFVGADTQGFFSRLVKENNAKKALLTDLVAIAQEPPAAIQQVLEKRKAAADAAKLEMQSIRELNLAAVAEAGLCAMALVQLERFGPSILATWAQQELSKLKPIPHQ